MHIYMYICSLTPCLQVSCPFRDYHQELNCHNIDELDSCSLLATLIQLSLGCSDEEVDSILEGRLHRETSIDLESQPLVSPDELEGIATKEDEADARTEAQAVDKKKQAVVLMLTQVQID